jgi:hypothetical protein
MDATGAGTTSTGQRTGPPDVTGSAEDVTAGPSGAVGPADATGPLPVQKPADPTGPLPAQEAGSWFGGGAETAAQPVVPTPSSWFATGPLPAVTNGPDSAAPDGGAVVEPGHTPAAPADLFAPANPPAPVPPAPPTGPMPALTPPPPPAQVAPSAPTAGVPVVPPAPPHAAEQPAGPTPPAPGLFTPPGPGSPEADLFAPAIPPVGPAAPEPPAAPPLHSTDATGPMPVISAPPAVVPPPAGPQQPPAPAAQHPAAQKPAAQKPAAQKPAQPGADAWSFGPEQVRIDAVPSPADGGRRGGTGSWPIPRPTGGGHSPTVTVAPTPAGAAVPAKRKAWPLTVVGVLVAVAAGIGLVFAVARTNPADLADTAATDAGSWPGAHYQGAVAANDGGEIQVDLTVTPDGASGTLSRDGGRASAELLWDQGGALIRGNREWWLYHQTGRADDLAGNWVADPVTETQEIEPVLHLSGPALAAYVHGEQPAQWQAIEQQLVDGRSGIVLFDGARRVVVGSEDAHPLLALDVASNPKTPPVPVARATDEEIAAVSGAAARVRQEAAPKTLAQVLQERPNVGIQLQPDPLCVAQTCNVTVTVTNTGTAPARGHLEVSADGQVVANHPLDVPPGQVATFTASAPNPQFAQPGATGRIFWETRAVDD